VEFSRIHGPVLAVRRAIDPDAALGQEFETLALLGVQGRAEMEV
jgi:hypothetical protein